ncbi:hypothetical protein HU200_018915 [Digitaria exilis]|uniref:Uncharacterized protein n=1 Tax=Digitaria exilis TaxID=1010633 RepID=A0A835KG00_9POAL|nr:hypothetical protein HU200_018915 [Digitaria exilis]CAB3460946.1 unnamed protein product [Digitaria exilis]
MSSGQSSQMESTGGPPCPHHGGGDGGAPPAVSAKKVWRAMQAAYLVVVKKHQPKITALGVHLHHLLSGSSKRNHHRSLAAAPEQHPALTYLSSLSCRSMDPNAAVVHPYPRGRGHRLRRASSSSRPATHSLSCRSMDPAAAVCQYQYRPREVEFSCKSTPLHKRRRREQRLLHRLQEDRAAAQERDLSSERGYYYGSAVAVTRLFELMDVEEASKATDLADYDGDELDLEATVAWPALTAGPAPRQVRITDSPYMMWDDDDEEGWGGVDRRADEFIMRFHEQLRAQQPQPQRSTRWVR